MGSFRLLTILTIFAVGQASLLRTAAENVRGVTKEQAVQAREQLETLGAKLKQLFAPSGPLAHTRISEHLESFVTTFDMNMAAAKTAEDQQIYDKEMSFLSAVKGSVQKLTDEITAEQAHIAEEGAQEEGSLLLSVLMQRKDSPIEQQLEVLKADDFKELPILDMLKFFLQKRDVTTPLYQQVAMYLDSHHPASNAAMVAEPKKVGGKPDLSPIVVQLEARLQKLARAQVKRKLGEEAQLAVMEEAAARHEKDKDSKGAKTFRLVEKSERRKFAKEDAVEQEHIDTLKAAIKAVKSGDIQGLMQAQKKMTEEMDALQKKSHKFLVMLDLLHKSQGEDCPYCAAQCVDKCHTEGKTYVTCLTECADVGKSPKA